MWRKARICKSCWLRDQCIRRRLSGRVRETRDALAWYLEELKTQR